MIVGSAARPQVWRPMAEFLASRGDTGCARAATTKAMTGSTAGTAPTTSPAVTATTPCWSCRQRRLRGGLGDDRLAAGTPGLPDGGDGDDVLLGRQRGGLSERRARQRPQASGATAATIWMGGTETIVLPAATATDDLSGDAGDDRLSGGDRNDSLYGGDGNDHLAGGLGDDYLVADDGDDAVVRWAAGRTTSTAKTATMRVAPMQVEHGCPICDERTARRAGGRIRPQARRERPGSADPRV